MIISRCRLPNLKKCLARTASNRRKKGEVHIPEAKKITEPWNERKGVWKSTFELMEPKIPFFGPDWIRLMQTPIDLSTETIRRWVDKKTEDQEEHNQGFIKERLDILGPDLAAAHFIVHRGGAVRFYNEKEWVRCQADGSYILPRTYVPGLFLEAIDCKGVNLRATGLENILDLSKLRWLSLAGNPLVDDWSLDSVSGSYGERLQYLDISHCPKVSHRALSCFYRFRCLDTLVVEGISSSDEFRLSCMMLEDINPRLVIKGLDHNVSDLEATDVTTTK